MSNLITIDQIQYLFTFPFKEEGWQRKLLIGLALYVAGFIVPLIPWIFVMGYTARIIEQVIKDDEYRLPDWDDWGNYFMNGLRLTALSFVVVLPFLLLMGLTYIFMFSPLFVSVFTAPTYGRDVAQPMFFTWMLGWAGAMLTMGVGVFLTVLLGLFFPAAMSHLIAEDQFAAAFRVKEWWPIFKANIWGYVIAYILLLGTLYMTMFAVQLFYMTIVFCCLIPFVFGGVGIYTGVFMGAVFGQTYRVGRQKIGMDAHKDEKGEKKKS
jgi:hypothetical protein